MSHSVKIKAAGNKISAFVMLKKGATNGANVDKDIRKSTSTLEKEEGSDGYGEAADATVATFEAVAGSIDKFESGDPTQIAIGVLDILAEVSQFAALAGPHGAIIAAVVGPVCSIISSLLGAGTGEPVESEEDMLKRVVTQALSAARTNELQDAATGVTEVLNDRVRDVRNYLSKADLLGSGDRDIIRDPDYKDGGNAFLAELGNYIKRNSVTDDHYVANGTAQVITSYTSIAFVRIQYLYMLSALIGGDETAKVTAENTRIEAKDQLEDAQKLLKDFFGRPGRSNNVVYAKVFLQPETTLDLIEGICNMNFQGRLMAIYNTKQKNYLQVSQSSADRSEAKTRFVGSFTDLPNNQKFIVFGINSNTVEIFSLAHAGYVYAAGYKPKDDDRRRVNGWKPGDQIREGFWQQYNKDAFGSVWLRNTHWNEYLYAADFGASGSHNPVYTWRRQHPIDQGYWIFEDLRVAGDIKCIRSVSSRNVLNGRAPHHQGLDTIMLSKISDMTTLYKWRLIKLSDGTYNIKSISSNMYLDGRHEGIGDGPHVGLNHMSYERARNLFYFKWRITEYNYGGRKRYAIQSVSSKLYLDGRNAGDVGTKMLYLTGRNPQGDKYLMWDLE
jgi:hypothetical protein